MRRITLLVASTFVLPGFARAYYADFVKPMAPPPVSQQRSQVLIPSYYNQKILGGQIIALKNEPGSMYAQNHIDVGLLGGVKKGDVFAVYSPSGTPVGFIRVIEPSRYTSTFEFVELTIPPSTHLTVKMIPDSVRALLPPGLRVEPKKIALKKKSKGTSGPKAPAVGAVEGAANTGAASTLPPLPGTASPDNAGLPPLSGATTSTDHSLPSLPGTTTSTENSLPPLPGTNAQLDNSLPALPGSQNTGTSGENLPPLPMGDQGTPAPSSPSNLPPMPEMAMPSSKPPSSLSDVGALPPPDFPTGGPDGLPSLPSGSESASLSGGLPPLPSGDVTSAPPALPGVESPSSSAGAPSLPGSDLSAPPPLPGGDSSLPSASSSDLSTPPALPGMELPPAPGGELALPSTTASAVPAAPGLDLVPPPGVDLAVPPAVTASAAPAAPGLDLVPPPGADLAVPPAATASSEPAVPGLEVALPAGNDLLAPPPSTADMTTPALNIGSTLDVPAVPSSPTTTGVPAQDLPTLRSGKPTT